MLKKFVLGGMVVMAALLGNACGDDGSSESPAGPADSELTLSSSSDNAVSSSSEKNEAISSSYLSSSSSKKAVGNSSSINEKSSSSSGKVESSSGKGEKSSSSKKVESSSSTKTEVSSCSAKTEESSSSSVKISSSSQKSSSSSAKSSSSKPKSSSSSAKSSSSSVKSSSSTVVIPSKLYDCEKYKCVTTKYLNPEIDYGEYLDERDSLVYRTVQIGEQVWMAQNLNHYTVNSYCYADKDINCLSYGRLYDWQSAHSICPEGWHLPDTLDFGILRDYAIENNGGIGVGASLMHGKSDKFGFSSLAHGGYKPGKDGICGDNDADFFWTTIETADKNNYAEVRGFRSKKDYMIYSSLKKTWYLSVRCIKDN